MKKGFTLIETLVGVFLILIVFLGISGAYQLTLKVVTQSKARISATAIANQKLEEIRNLSYPEVRYTPEGKILKTEKTPDNKYTIVTTIIPITDPFDGLGGADNCENTDIDYKRIKVEVFWSFGGGGSVGLVTDVVPKTLAQECEEPSGVLSVSVIDANSQKVNSPKIEIIDPETGRIVITYQPLEGKYDFSLLPQKYKVKITAFNYSEKTYGENDVYYFDDQMAIIKKPEKEHPLIEIHKVKNITFQMDRLGTIEVQTRSTEEGHPFIPNISFTIRGTKLVGEDAEGRPIYKYFRKQNSGSSGKVILSQLEFDSYNFSVSSTLYNLARTDPPQPVSLLPGEDKIVKLMLEPQNSLLVNVLDASTSNPIFGAKVRLYKTDYDQTRPTNEKGKAFFAPLVPGNYDLEVKALNYSSHEERISISEGEKKEIEIRLTPN